MIRMICPDHRRPSSTCGVCLLATWPALLSDEERRDHAATLNRIPFRARTATPTVDGEPDEKPPRTRTNWQCRTLADLEAELATLQAERDASRGLRDATHDQVLIKRLASVREAIKRRRDAIKRETP